MRNELIYALCEKNGAPFYCGRTERTLEIRFKEHQYSYKTGTELKYQHIRNLPNQEFEIVLLQEVGPNTKSYEDFWIYTLILDGYDLTNMKAGDSIRAAERTAMEEFKKRGERFKDAESFLSAREIEMARAKAKKVNKKLLEKTRKVLPPSKDYSLGRFFGDFGAEPVSRGFQELITRRKK